MQATTQAEQAVPAGVCEVLNLLHLAQGQLADALASDPAAAAELNASSSAAQRDALQSRQQMLRRGCTAAQQQQ